MQDNQSKTVSSTKNIYVDMCLDRFGFFFSVQLITDFLKSGNYFNFFDYNELYLYKSQCFNFWYMNAEK